MTTCCAPGCATTTGVRPAPVEYPVAALLHCCGALGPLHVCSLQSVGHMASCAWAPLWQTWQLQAHVSAEPEAVQLRVWLRGRFAAVRFSPAPRRRGLVPGGVHRAMRAAWLLPGFLRPAIQRCLVKQGQTLTLVADHWRR